MVDKLKGSPDIDSTNAGRKLALITERSLDGYGGQQASTLNLLRFPGQWTLITPTLPLSADVSGIKVFQPKDIPIALPGVRNSMASPIDARRIGKDLLEENTEAVLFEDGGVYGKSFYRMLPPELRRRSNALWRHILNEPLDDLRLSPTRRALTVVFRGLEYNFARAVGTNLAVSEAVATSLSEIGVPDNNIAVIPEQVGDEFNAQKRLEDRDKPYAETTRSKFLDQDELGLLFVGRIMDLKGIDWIVKLYEELRKERKYLNPQEGSFNKVKITIVGPVERKYKEQFDKVLQHLQQIELETGQEYLADTISINYDGPKSHEELDDYYNAYDALYMPSVTEGFGRTTVEAMEGGMTVIGRKQTAATREILAGAPYPIGMLVDSPEAATTEVFGLIQHPKYLRELQSNALLWVNSHYSVENAQNGLWNALDRQHEIKEH